MTRNRTPVRIRAEFHFPEKQNDALYVVSKTADGKKIEIVVMPGPDFAF